jgi:predicted permease
MIHRIRSAIGALFHGNQLRHELDEEMAFHMDQVAEDLMRQGMSPEEARREARHRFGVTEEVHTRTRRARGVASFDELGRNVRFAFRSMRRSPLLTGAFVLTLALCIGFGTAVFSAVDSILWKPLPYPDGDRLALAGLYDPARGGIAGRVGVDGASWRRIRDEAAEFETAVYSGWVRGVNLSTVGSAQFVQQQRVGAGFFRTLGVDPLMGREFAREEDVTDGPPLVILSHALWENTFAADPNILGSTARLKGELHTVIGVMPPDFRSDAEADLWTPLRPSASGEGGGTNYTALVRVPAGMTWEEAQARFAAIEAPSRGDGAQDVRFGLSPLDEALSAGIRLPLLVLLGAVGLMILVGAANLAGIQVSRTLARETEMATRQALGSGARALVRQLLAENLILGLLGGVLGLGVAALALDGLEVLLRSNLGTLTSMEIDGRALSAALGLTGLATLLFGLAPLLQVGRRGALRLLVSGTRGVAGGRSRTLRKLLLVGEVAMVTVLLFAAVLLARSYGHLASLEPGFDPTGVLTVQFSLDDARYADAGAVNGLFEETVDELRSIPGITSAAVALSLPYERPLNMPFRLEGEENGQQPRLANLVYVTPEFFETLRIPLREGRGIDARDQADAPAVVLANQALLGAHFEGRAALGARIHVGGGDALELVGVVGDVQQGGGGWGSAQPVWAAPTLYIPAAQGSGPMFQQVHVWFSPSWVIRAPAQSPQLASQIARVFESQDGELPVARAASLEEVMAKAFARTRFQAAFLFVVAGFALLLAGVGLYGIVAQEVLERRREMGVRMALGSTPGRAIWTTGLAGIRLATWGLLAGGVAATAAGRVLASLLWGVSPSDPITILALISGIGGLALVASFVPAMRMGRMDPARVLRE